MAQLRQTFRGPGEDGRPSRLGNVLTPKKHNGIKDGTIRVIPREEEPSTSTNPAEHQAVVIGDLKKKDHDLVECRIACEQIEPLLHSWERTLAQFDPRMTGGPADKLAEKSVEGETALEVDEDDLGDDTVWKRIPKPQFDWDTALARAAGFRVDVEDTGPVAPTCIRDTLKDGDETMLRQQLQTFFDGSVTRYRNMENSLREFEQGVFAEEQTIKNLETLTQELPHHFGQFKFPPSVREVGCQAEDVGYGNWMEHRNAGWSPPSLYRFLQPPDPKNPQPRSRVSLDQLEKLILEILSERVAHSLSRDFADVDEEEIDTKISKKGKKKHFHSHEPKGNQKPALAQPWMVSMMEKTLEHKVQGQRFLGKLSASRNMAIMGEPAQGVSVNFPDFVICFFTKAGFKHQLGDFVRSLAHEVSSGAKSPRLKTFWRLCQFDSSDYIKDSTANRIFATLANATREICNTQLSVSQPINQKLQRELVKEIVEGRYVLATWKEKSNLHFPHVGFNQKALEAACRTCCLGLGRRSLHRIATKSALHSTKLKDGQVEHSAKKQVDLDSYLAELVDEMQIVEMQQKFAFERFYWRLQRRHAPDGHEGTLHGVEVPPRVLEESLCLFTGTKFESLFYHLYAQSVHPSEPGDRTGTFNPAVFAELLLHHNINLCKLVGAITFMFLCESWRARLMAEGKLKFYRSKDKKGKRGRGRSTSPGRRSEASPDTRKTAVSPS